MSAGIRALAEGRAGGEYQSVYGRAEGFLGGELSASAKATKEELTVGAKAFVGGRAVSTEAWSQAASASA